MATAFGLYACLLSICSVTSHKRDVNVARGLVLLLEVCKRSSALTMTSQQQQQQQRKRRELIKDLVESHKARTADLVKTRFPQKALEFDVLGRHKMFSLATHDALLAATRTVRLSSSSSYSSFKRSCCRSSALGYVIHHHHHQWRTQRGG